MPVSISVGPDEHPTSRVPASLLSSEEESINERRPSARQKTSESSVSTRLHWGQRFMFLLKDYQSSLFQTHPLSKSFNRGSS